MGGTLVGAMLGDGGGGFAGAAFIDAGLLIAGPLLADFNRDGGPKTWRLGKITFILQARKGLMLGTGSGDFGSPIFSASATIQLAGGDFNGDGWPDVAVAPYGPGVNILLGRGDGTFEAAMNVPVERAVQAVSVADLEARMACPDLAVGGQEKGLSILLGRGDGTFVRGRTTPSDQWIL